MSEGPAAPTAVVVPAADTVPTPTTETAPTTSAATETVAPAVPAKDDAPAAVAPAVLAAEAAPAAATADLEPKSVEPVTEGHLGYKAPGLLKQFTFAKKDFWFSDEPVSPEHLNLYLRGEKAEIAHPVVAWASQTGKGLMFFVKKNETAKTHPAGVLALYDATDLKKTSPHEFAFRLHNQSHSFKAASDVERDGWYVSIEKAIEMGKANKENVHESEAYKAELAKLNTPAHTTIPAAAVPAVAATTTTAAGAAAPVAPAEIEDGDAKRANSSDGEELRKRKNPKSRSTSRGFVNLLMGKKDELEHKMEEKKEEKKIEHEEKKAEKEAKKTDEVPVVAAAAPIETKKEEPVEAATTTEERPKASKRGSIFCSLKSSFLSPTKEKEQKDAELKADNTVVSDAPPQLPETAVASEPAVVPTIAATEPAAETAVPRVEEDKTVPAETISTPNREKKTFLSGLSFINKRDRSVSPSAPKETEAEKTVEKPVETTETPAVAAATTTDDEKVEDTPVANKRQSMLGGLGRRASKMIQRVQSSQKKETVSPVAATEGKTEAEKVEEETAVTEISPAATGVLAGPPAAAVADGAEVLDKPEPVTASAPPAVTASA